MGAIHLLPSFFYPLNNMFATTETTATHRIEKIQFVNSRGHLKQRVYKEHEIHRNCESALNIERPELLRFKQESDKQIPLVFVTKYHFSLGNINKALRKHDKKTTSQCEM